MKKSLKKKLGWAAGIVAITAVVADVVASVFLINYALKPERRPLSQDLEKAYKRNPELRPWVDSLRASGGWHDTTLTMRGTTMHAVIIPAARKTDKVAVLVHGYKNAGVAMLSYGHLYWNMGFNLVLPDLYGHGRSGGNSIGMGWKERLDVLNWMAVADRLFAGPQGHSQMVVHGVSMGAATTMSVSGEPLPVYVKCLVEDCGYTSVNDEFKHELKDQFGLPAFPLLPTASLLCKLSYGWSFTEASPIKQVAKCQRPMLFIHGDNDDFVPSWMVHPLYAAKQGPKELYISKGSTHARSINNHPAEYAARLKAFVIKYIH